MRHLVGSVALLLMLGNNASAEFLSLDFGGSPPSTYTPGTDVTFNVKLVGAEMLSSYYLEIVLQCSTGTPDVDFGFGPVTDPISGALASQYVFGPGGTGNFFALFVVSPLGDEHRLVLSD